MSVVRPHGDRIWQYICEKCERERLLKRKVRSGKVWSSNPCLLTKRVRTELGRAWNVNSQTVVRYSSVCIRNFCCDYVHAHQHECWHRSAKETELYLHDASRRGGERVFRGSGGASGSTRCMFISPPERRREEESHARRDDDALHRHDVMRSRVVGVSYPGSGAAVDAAEVAEHAVQDAQDVTEDVTTRAFIPEYGSWA